MTVDIFDAASDLLKLSLIIFLPTAKHAAAPIPCMVLRKINIVMSLENAQAKDEKEKIKGFYGFSQFISPYPLAIENISRVWFKKLLNYWKVNY